MFVFVCWVVLNIGSRRSVFHRNAAVEILCNEQSLASALFAAHGGVQIYPQWCTYLFTIVDWAFIAIHSAKLLQTPEFPISCHPQYSVRRRSAPHAVATQRQSQFSVLPFPAITITFSLLKAPSASPSDSDISSRTASCSQSTKSTPSSFSARQQSRCQCVTHINAAAQRKLPPTASMLRVTSLGKSLARSNTPLTRAAVVTAHSPPSNVDWAQTDFQHWLSYSV